MKTETMSRIIGVANGLATEKKKQAEAANKGKGKD
jgi:hypothetical protein